MAELTPEDIYLFKQGTFLRAFEKLGAHVEVQNNRAGTRFALWAPNAEAVSVVGDFNGWNPGAHPHAGPLAIDSGIWELFVPDVGAGTLYKYHIRSRVNGYTVEKADPFALALRDARRAPPRWCGNSATTGRRAPGSQQRPIVQTLDAPWSIYEVHLGSWRRNPEQGNRSLTYRELAQELGDYVVDMGFTHVELLPVMEHPFFGSWGYQITGYFTPSARYGTPQDFMYLVDQLHQRGIGVILDWVPSHFPSDEHGLAFFDGTHLYEHADPRQGFHPEWNSAIFNYGRAEVR